MGYISIPIETNPETLAQEIFAYIQANAPGWVPSDGNLDVWIIRALASKAAENRTLASDVPDDIMMFLGSSLYGLPPTDAAFATSTTTWTMIDNLGHSIPSGSLVGIRNSAGDLTAFETVNTVIVAPGDTVTAAGEVVIRAIDPGVSGNGLNQVPELIDIYDWVLSIALVAPTDGGVDAESVEDYLTNLVRRFQLFTETPILPEEFASAALNADPAIARAVCIDLYDPVANTYGHDRTVTIAAVYADGTAVSGAIKTEIATYLESLREVNFVVHTMDPKYTLIDVAATVSVLSGFDAASVSAAVIAALNSYLSHATWGTDPTVTTSSGLNQTWVDTQHVYYNELIALVSDVAGVNRVTDLTVNIHGNAPGRVDIALSAPASLTTPSTITCATV